MTKRIGCVVLVTVAAAVAVPAVSSAVTTQTTKSTMKLLSGQSFVPNRFLKSRDRFEKDVYNLRSGTTIKITTDGPPHLVSVVKKSDQPKTLKPLEICQFGGGGICSDIFAAHGFPPGEGDPTTPLVNKGAAGFDTVGDSIYIPPGRGKGTVKLTAAKGKRLYLLCAIHPWMQAKIQTK